MLFGQANSPTSQHGQANSPTSQLGLGRLGRLDSLGHLYGQVGSQDNQLGQDSQPNNPSGLGPNLGNPLNPGGLPSQANPQPRGGLVQTQVQAPAHQWQLRSLW